METTVLQYRSPQLLCGLPKEFTDRKTLDQWRIYEDIQLSEEYSEMDKKFYVYQVVLEREVNYIENHKERMEELSIFRSQALKYIHELRIVAPLVYGFAFLQFDSNSNFQKETKAWKSNLKDVFCQLYPRLPYGTVSIWPIRQVSYPYMPLSRLLKVRESYLKSSSQLKALVELHFDIHESNEHTRLFILANSLELIRALLPGKKDGDKMNYLLSHFSEEVKASFSKDISWLSNIANNRYSLRHILRSKDDLILHPSLTQEESFDFQSNALKIMRATICQALGIEYIMSNPIVTLNYDPDDGNELTMFSL